MVAAGWLEKGKKSVRDTGEGVGGKDELLRASGQTVGSLSLGTSFSLPLHGSPYSPSTASGTDPELLLGEFPYSLVVLCWVEHSMLG